MVAQDSAAAHTATDAATVQPTTAQAATAQAAAAQSAAAEAAAAQAATAQAAAAQTAAAEACSNDALAQRKGRGVHKDGRMELRHVRPPVRPSILSPDLTLRWGRRSAVDGRSARGDGLRRAVLGAVGAVGGRKMGGIGAVVGGQ